MDTNANAIEPFPHDMGVAIILAVGPLESAAKGSKVFEYCSQVFDFMKQRWGMMRCGSYEDVLRGYKDNLAAESDMHHLMSFWKWAGNNGFIGRKCGG